MWWCGRKDPRTSGRRRSQFSDSPPQHIRKYQRRDDRRIALDDVLRRVDAELAPRDLLVRHGAGVRTVRRGRVADLAEVAPERDAGALQVLMQHRDDADREVAGDAAADLEEADRLS